MRRVGRPRRRVRCLLRREGHPPPLRAGAVPVGAEVWLRPGRQDPRHEGLPRRARPRGRGRGVHHHAGPLARQDDRGRARGRQGRVRREADDPHRGRGRRGGGRVEAHRARRHRGRAVDGRRRLDAGVRRDPHRGDRARRPRPNGLLPQRRPRPVALLPPRQADDAEDRRLGLVPGPPVRVRRGEGRADAAGATVRPRQFRPVAVPVAVQRRAVHRHAHAPRHADVGRDGRAVPGPRHSRRRAIPRIRRPRRARRGNRRGGLRGGLSARRHRDHAERLPGGRGDPRAARGDQVREGRVPALQGRSRRAARASPPGTSR